MVPSTGLVAYRDAVDGAVDAVAGVVGVVVAHNDVAVGLGRKCT